LPNNYGCASCGVNGPASGRWNRRPERRGVLRGMEPGDKAEEIKGRRGKTNRRKRKRDPKDSEVKVMRVLLVDDDEITLRMLGHTLEQAGYETRAAEDGARGLEIFEDFAPDLVLCDIEMPEMNGLELLAAIRERSAEAIVVMATACGSESYAIEALRARANDYLRKPVEPRQLLALLKKYAGALEPASIATEMANLIVRNAITYQIDNSIDRIYNIIDHMLMQAGRALTQDDRLAIRLGLGELITNSIEHGNLGITYEEKTEALVEEGKFFELVKTRLMEPERAERKVTIQFKMDESGWEWVIEDEGEGFDWRSLPKEPDGGDLWAMHGRGILISRFPFDEFEYRGAGNIVRVKKYRHGQRDQILN